MTRLLAVSAALVLFLLSFAPLALAAEPDQTASRTLIAIDGDVTVPVGDHADSLMVISGTATILGDVDSLIVIDGGVNLRGSADTIVGIQSAVVLEDGATVSGDVRILGGSVTRAPSVQVGGTVGVVDLVAAGAVLQPALFAIYVAFACSAIGAALLLAAVAGRQVRAAEALLSADPVRTFLTGFGAAIAIPVAGALVVATVVGIPLGLGILVVVLPLLAFAGYVVAAIWMGDWILAQMSSSVSRERPYVAATVGMLVMFVLGFLPALAGIATLFGFGAVVGTMWRAFRGDASSRRTSALPASAPAAT
jgi:hypothetical protein